MFPQFSLPEPTGPYAVGTTDLFLVDRDRPETFTPDPDDRREIAARIWYPADPVAGDVPVAYMEHAADVSRALTRSTPFPPFLFTHLRRPKAVESVHIWVADISAVLDELERQNDGDGPFARRLDTRRVAVIGHSFGGAAAGQACLDDPRCKAGINFDGLQIGDMIDRPLEVPFLFFHHDNVGALNRAPNLPFFERALAPAYPAIIAGTGHLSFSDLCLYPRTSLFRLASPIGTIDGRRCQTIVNAYVLAFLDRYVRGRDQVRLEGLSERLPEVELRARRP